MRFSPVKAIMAMVAVMLLTLVTGCSNLGSNQRLANGTLVFGLGQEPAILNPWLSEGNLQATHNLSLTMLYPLWRVTPDFQYEPLLLDGEPEIVSENPFIVDYKLKEDAVWSDGVPITARDIQFTLETCLNPDFNIAVRAGCQAVDMKKSKILNDKTFRMVFKRQYAPWKSLFSSGPGSILPAHELEGKNFNNVWDDGISVSSGPYKFKEWNRGQDLTLVRNENFWGPKPYFDRIVFRFIEDSTVQVQALRGGEIDMLTSSAQVDLVEQVKGIEGVEYAVPAGGVWEFFEFNWNSKGLSKNHRFVREAIAMGINREQLVDALIAPMNPDAKPLQSLIYLNGQPEYEPAFNQWSYDPEAARKLLDKHGCEPGDDGIRVCDGVRLSFRWGFTSGDELRELQFVIVQSYLEKIGIELKPQAQDAATYFGETWPAGNWDLFDAAWLNSADPNPVLEFWECEGAFNYRGYCKERVTELIQKSRTELDEKQRAKLLNQANALMADQLPALPLYRKPSFLGWSSQITGVRPVNATVWGFLWNVEEWGVE
ncbi:peptide ABC transporter substrate-binding protein [Arthrobacter pigmenti]